MNTFGHALAGERCTGSRVTQTLRAGRSVPESQLSKHLRVELWAESNYITGAHKKRCGSPEGNERRPRTHRSRGSFSRSSRTNGPTFLQKHEDTEDVPLQRKGRNQCCRRCRVTVRTGRTCCLTVSASVRDLFSEDYVTSRIKNKSLTDNSFSL